MEALSVIASITGVLAVAAKITTALAALIEKERDAPRSIRRMLTELTDLRACLDQLEPFIRGIKNAEKSRKDGISVDQVVAISTSLVKKISELDKMLDSFGPEGPVSVTARLRWTKNEEKIDKILTHIGRSKSSLSLILTIFTWWVFRKANGLNLRIADKRLSSASTQAAQTSISDLRSAVQKILQTDEDVSRRLAGLEAQFANPSRHADSTLRAPPSNDNSSNRISLAQDKWDHDTFSQSSRQIDAQGEPHPGVVEVASSSTPKDQSSSQQRHSSLSVGQQRVRFDLTLEFELYASRVYSRNIHRHSTSSSFSAENSATGSSFLSGLSLAQISTLSVVSLPILCQELWNPQQYQIPQNSGKPASLIAEKLLKLRKSRKALLKSPRKAEPTAGSTRSEQLYQMLKSEKKILEKEIKVVLLGVSGSGKSTVRKQLQLLCETGFTSKQRLDSPQIIFDNLALAFRMISDGRREWGVEYKSEKLLHYEQLLHSRYGFRDGQNFYAKTFLSPIKALFADEGFQRVVKEGNKTALLDNFQYYSKKIDSLLSPEYIPNDQDVLHTRMKTVGLLDSRLKFGKLDCVITDVGSTRSRRREWVHLFNGVDCVIFTASLSGYDQCLIKNKSANQTEESLLEFDSILSLSCFKRSTVILLLSKLDLFQEKVSHSPIKRYFPDYTGADDDSEAAQKFFVDQYRAIAQKQARDVRVYCTNLTDTDCFRPILKDIEASIRDDHNVEGEFIGR